jgi:hypothetical protein
MGFPDIGWSGRLARFRAFVERLGGYVGAIRPCHRSAIEEESLEIIFLAPSLNVRRIQYPPPYSASITVGR